jgi:hypothetical protein
MVVIRAFPSREQKAPSNPIGNNLQQLSPACHALGLIIPPPWASCPYCPTLPGYHAIRLAYAMLYRLHQASTLASYPALPSTLYPMPETRCPNRVEGCEGKPQKNM